MIPRQPRAGSTVVDRLRAFFHDGIAPTIPNLLEAINAAAGRIQCEGSGMPVLSPASVRTRASSV